MKDNKGITLIALVITIIVMLILVVVTINVATDGNLFTHAANAAKATNAHVQNETAILNDELDSSIENIVAAQTGTATPEVTLIHFTVAGTPYTAVAGTTWLQWVDTPYNTDGFFVDSVKQKPVKLDSDHVIDGVKGTDEITASDYTWK